MKKTTVVYEGLLNPANIIACQEGDVMAERDELKEQLEQMRETAETESTLGELADLVEKLNNALGQLAEARNALQMIVHATEPSHDDGAYHENAHSLAVAGLSASA